MILYGLGDHFFAEIRLLSGQNLLQDQVRLMDMLDLEHHSPTALKLLRAQSDVMASQLTNGEPGARRDLLQTIIHRIDISSGIITVTLSRKGLATMLQVSDAVSTKDHGDVATITVPFTLRRRGVEIKIVIEGNGETSSAPDANLIRYIKRSHYWWKLLTDGKISSVRELAEFASVDASDITRFLPLAFLAPDIVEVVLKGHQPIDMNVERLKRISPIPADWNAQKQLLEFPS